MAVATSVPKADESRKPDTAAINCPLCARTDQVFRVEGILMKDLRTGSGGVGMVDAGGSYSVGGFTGTSASKLGQSLAPPTARSADSGALVVSLILLAIASFVGMNALNISSDSSGIWLATAFLGGLGLFFGYFYFVDDSKRWKFIREELPQRYAAWQNLRYCERCATVFDPASNTHCGIADAPRIFGAIIGPQRFKSL